MKKILLSLIVACTIVGAASAQSYMNVGIGYASDTFYESSGSLNVNTNVGSLCLSMGGFSGETLGFFSSASFGLPSSLTVTSGSSSMAVSTDTFSTKMHVDCVFGLGYRFVSGELDVMVGAGAGFASTLLVPKNIYADSTLFTALGPGGALSVSYNITPMYALYASVHGFYGVMQIVEEWSYFTHSIVIAPAAGLRIKIR